ncbi:MAG: hypothetical protein IKE55_04885, partial [Kiritimatiellae bacterium]|nr:hypothetical protein [Kiritimatiellia bacterium]
WNAELKLTGADLTAAPGSVVKWTPAMRSALAYCIAAELSIPLAGRVDDLKNWRTLYAEKLARARVLSLETERSAVTDRTHIDVLSLLVPHFDPADSHLPRSIKTLTDRADALADSARYAILSDHDWNFARAEDRIAQSCPVPHGCGPYSFAAEVPPGCAHLEAVLTHGGRMDDWKVFEDRFIVAREPVVSIIYTRDDKKPEKWPPLIRRAFLYRLAAEVSQTEVPKLFEAMEAKASEALVEARARDARESNTPRDAWGRNHHVDAMRGRNFRCDERRMPSWEALR